MGGRITGRSHTAAWLVPNTWLLFPPLPFSLSSSLPVSSNQESLPLSPPGKSCLPPSFLVSCFLLYAVLLKNSFSLNKLRKIAPSHYRWAGHPPRYSHPHLGLSTRSPKREELFWAKERGSQTRSWWCPECDSVDSPAGYLRNPSLSSETLWTPKCRFSFRRQEDKAWCPHVNTAGLVWCAQWPGVQWIQGTPSEADSWSENPSSTTCQL